MVKQPFLAIEPAAVAGHFPAGANDPMARHHNGNRILAIRRTDGARRLRIADPPRQFPIGDRCAARDTL